MKIHLGRLRGATLELTKAQAALHLHRTRHRQRYVGSDAYEPTCEICTGISAIESHLANTGAALQAALQTLQHLAALGGMDADDIQAAPSFDDSQLSRPLQTVTLPTPTPVSNVPYAPISLAGFEGVDVSAFSDTDGRKGGAFYLRPESPWQRAAGAGR